MKLVCKDTSAARDGSVSLQICDEKFVFKVISPAGARNANSDTLRGYIMVVAAELFKAKSVERSPRPRSKAVQV